MLPATPPPLPPPAPGQLAAHVMHFARLLRSAGMPVGSDRVHTALAALQVAGLESQGDFRAVLAACLIDRVEHQDLFDQAFALFWRPPELMSRLQALLAPPAAPGAAPPAAPDASPNQRLAQALNARAPEPPAADPANADTRHAVQSWTDREHLRQADFDSMSVDEWREARRLLAQMKLIFQPLPTRRSRPARRPGGPDWRATLAAMARHGGELWQTCWRAPRDKPAPLLVLADISGSMSRYSRMLLHFAHALGHAGAPVESFVFGTRLTRTTRLLKNRDPDIAVSQVVRAVADWSGGTRITHSLHAFNQQWARRVLSGRTTVLLISDGLEHGDTAPLAFEMERLHKRCRRLLWLNPLLRFRQFEPRAAGIKAMLPHCDRFLPAHNLQSLADLVAVLAAPDVRGLADLRPTCTAS